jgi:hypothetical protein
MRTATSDSGITVFKQAVDQAPMLRGSHDFASVATYQMFVNKLFTNLNAGRQERYLEEVAKLQQ